MALNYSSYLKIPELLALQQPLSDDTEHDEHLFITIHQVYELWFKQVLHELEFFRTSLTRGETYRASSTMKRILTILKTMVSQVDILETLTPLGFLSFRDRLESGSGFQSIQFRKLEIELGFRDQRKFHHYDSSDRSELEKLCLRPTLYQVFLQFLSDQGKNVPMAALEMASPEKEGGFPEPNREVQRVLLQIYREDPSLASLCERLVDLDEGIQEWRYRHVKMVERTIGFKQGTGGSEGAPYLRGTLFRPAFPDLWAIRTEF